jgi:hypothetical protein
MNQPGPPRTPTRPRAVQWAGKALVASAGVRPTVQSGGGRASESLGRFTVIPMAVDGLPVIRAAVRQTHSRPWVTGDGTTMGTTSHVWTSPAARSPTPGAGPDTPRSFCQRRRERSRGALGVGPRTGSTPALPTSSGADRASAMLPPLASMLSQLAELSAGSLGGRAADRPPWSPSPQPGPRRRW